MRDVFNQLYRLGWTATRRQIPRPARLPTEVFERAVSLFDTGQYAAAKRLLEEHHDTIVVEDPRALNQLAMATWAAAGDESDIKPVEDLLDQAEIAATRLLAGTEINRATLYKTCGQLDKALAAATRARALAPSWYPGHLCVLAVLEYMRDDDPDIGPIRHAISEMDAIVEDHPQLEADLREDPDYRRIRNLLDNQTEEKS